MGVCGGEKGQVLDNGVDCGHVRATRRQLWMRHKEAKEESSACLATRKADRMPLFLFPFPSLLHCRAQGKKMAMKQILPFGTDMARGLTHMHSNGVVHCDVKTKNILVHSAKCLVSPS